MTSLEFIISNMYSLLDKKLQHSSITTSADKVILHPNGLTDSAEYQNDNSGVTMLSKVIIMIHGYLKRFIFVLFCFVF